MALVIIYAAELLMLPALYIGGWLALWYATKRPDLQSLLALIKEDRTGQTVATITAVAVLLINRNRDGIPDSLEDKVDNKDPSPQVSPDRRVPNGNGKEAN